MHWCVCVVFIWRLQLTEVRSSSQKCCVNQNKIKFQSLLKNCICGTSKKKPILSLQWRVVCRTLQEFNDSCDQSTYRTTVLLTRTSYPNRRASVNNFSRNVHINVLCVIFVLLRGLHNIYYTNQVDGNALKSWTVEPTVKLFYYSTCTIALCLVVFGRRLLRRKHREREDFPTQPQR